MTGSAGPAQAPAGPLGLAWCTAYQLLNILIIGPGQAFSGEQEAAMERTQPGALSSGVSNLLRTLEKASMPSWGHMEAGVGGRREG